MKDFLDNIIQIMIIMIILFGMYKVGQETTEAKYCRQNNKHWSWDYGECVK